MSFTFYSTEQIFNLPPLTWLIYRVLPESGLGLLFGPPGEGKSFVALDWALSVSSGQKWLGKYPVKQGHVLYIASEGGRGIAKRVAAWQQLHGVPTLPQTVWFLDSINVLEDGVVDAFIEELENRFPSEVRVNRDTGDLVEVSEMNLKLVVVDTLSRNFGGQDENTNAMSQFVDRIEAFAKKHNALVLIVHHSNATGSRERGHTSLKGAMEAQFHCTATKEDGTLDVITLENLKQKDDREKEHIYLKPLCLELPAIPLDEEGNLQTSLVLESTDPAEDPEVKAVAQAAMSTDAALRLLAASEQGYTFSEWRLATGITKTSFWRRVNKLVDDGKVVKGDTGRYTVAVEEE